MRNPRRAAREVAAKSKFMNDRLRNQMFELSDDMRQIVLSQNIGERTQAWWIKKGYILQSTAQNIVDLSVWQGAYNQAIESSPTGETIFAMEQRAVREADQAVRLSQGSFSPEDVAGYEKGSPAGRLWTQFTSYFNTVLNQIIFDTSKSRAEKGIGFLMAFTVPMLMAEVISMTLYDRWDPEDDGVDDAVLREFFLYSQIKGGLAMIPGLGSNTANLLDLAFFKDRPAGDRVVTSPTHATIARSALGMLNAAKDLFDEDEDVKTRDVRDVISLIVLMYPYGGAALAPLIRPITYGTGLLREETEPTSELDRVRGFLTGFASKGSRQ
jgi:hypothetical protein